MTQDLYHRRSNATSDKHIELRIFPVPNLWIGLFMNQAESNSCLLRSQENQFQKPDLIVIKMNTINLLFLQHPALFHVEQKLRNSLDNPWT
jgi:hypothetical protein